MSSDSARVLPFIIHPSAGTDALQQLREGAELNQDRLARHGALLFRGFAIDSGQAFEQFARTLTGDLYGDYGDLPKEAAGQDIYESTPYPATEMILFHNESSHMTSWPTRQLFYCAVPARRGGATPIVDCRRMLDRLAPEVVDAFERKGLRYVRVFNEGLDVPWQEFFRTSDRGEVEAKCGAMGIQAIWLADGTLRTEALCPAVLSHPVTGERVFFNQVQLHHPATLNREVREDLVSIFGAERLPRNVTYGDGSPIGDDVIADVGQAYEHCAVRFSWQAGDVVLLDNMLVAHARDPFEGPRKIMVAMGRMMQRSTVWRN